MAWGPFNAGGGGGSSGGTAADISYDNSKSGISAANVQEAIDALSVLTLTIQAVPTPEREPDLYRFHPESHMERL